VQAQEMNDRHHLGGVDGALLKKPQYRLEWHGVEHALQVSLTSAYSTSGDMLIVYDIMNRVVSHAALKYIVDRLSDIYEPSCVRAYVR